MVVYGEITQDDGFGASSSGGNKHAREGLENARRAFDAAKSTNRRLNMQARNADRQRMLDHMENEH